MIKPPGSFPGMRSFAMAPMTKPIITVHSIAITKKAKPPAAARFF
jgi:hypothetical protein